MRLLPVLLLLAACAPEGPEAGDLVAALGTCAVIEGTQPFATDVTDGRPSGTSVDLCATEGAVWWRADLDVSCDGGVGEACLADPDADVMTATTDADGLALDASTVPYVSVPLPWQSYADRAADFFYCDHGLVLGGPVAVVYDGVVAYGVIGDEGPVTTEASGAPDTTCAGTPHAGGVVGEASYAMAEALGVDPDPETGGVVCDGDCAVTYVLFTAPAVDPVEDPEAAERVGVELANALVGQLVDK